MALQRPFEGKGRRRVCVDPNRSDWGFFLCPAPLFPVCLLTGGRKAPSHHARMEAGAGEGLPAAHPSPTRQALCAQAEELAVELVRWKVWHVEGHTHKNLQEAQAMQALAMVLVELLDDVHGSQTAVHTELARAVALLGYTLHARGEETVPQALWANAAEHGDDAAFLRTHGLRFCEGTHPDAPVQEP